MQSTKDLAENQQYEIPATRRQDGSWRKARRVRPGFVPQEEVPLYTPKGKRIAQANVNSFPPGWHPEVAKAQTKPKPKPPATVAEKPQTQVKKPPQNLNKAIAPINDLAESLDGLKIQNREDVLDISKRLKRLRRRLRELELLEEKINQGEIVKPQKDQLEKIQKKEEFEKEMEELERMREELKAQGFKGEL